MLAFRPQDEALWLASEPTWTSHLGQGWQGTRVLGRGSFGVTGLWEYKGDAPNPPAIKQVVVKQTQFGAYDLGGRQHGDNRSTLDEGNLGIMLGSIRAKHLVRQYGGNRLGDRFVEMDKVVRIFLEYCPGGDLQQFLSNVATQMKGDKQPMSEMDLWGIFRCMALGILAMDKRTEDPQDASGWYDDEELMHCDLKPDNVFLGFRDVDHSRIPIAKIGDFGEGIMVPGVELQDDDFGAKHMDRGADDFKPPEECINWRYSPWQSGSLPVPQPRKGTCSNVFQVGCIMNSLLLLEMLNFNPQVVDDRRDPRTTYSTLAPLGTYQQTNLNHSIRLETAELSARYSKGLRLLIQECLLRPPQLRPDSVELVKRCVAGLNAAILSIVAIAARTGTTGLPPLSQSLLNVPMREPGYTDPEPPTAWNVNHRIWDEATSRPSSSLSGIFNTGLSGLVTSLSKLGGIASGSTSGSSSRSGLFGFTAIRFPGSRPSTPEVDGRPNSKVQGSVLRAARALTSNPGGPREGSLVPKVKRVPVVYLQADEPGFVVVNRQNRASVRT